MTVTDVTGAGWDGVAGSAECHFHHEQRGKNAVVEVAVGTRTHLRLNHTRHTTRTEGIAIRYNLPVHQCHRPRLRIAQANASASAHHIVHPKCSRHLTAAVSPSASDASQVRFSQPVQSSCDKRACLSGVLMRLRARLLGCAVR